MLCGRTYQLSAFVKRYNNDMKGSIFLLLDLHHPTFASHVLKVKMHHKYEKSSSPARVESCESNPASSSGKAKSWRDHIHHPNDHGHTNWDKQVPYHQRNWKSHRPFSVCNTGMDFPYQRWHNHQNMTYAYGYSGGQRSTMGIDNSTCVHGHLVNQKRHFQSCNAHCNTGSKSSTPACSDTHPETGNNVQAQVDICDNSTQGRKVYEPLESSLSRKSETDKGRKGFSKTVDLSETQDKMEHDEEQSHFGKMPSVPQFVSAHHLGRKWFWINRKHDKHHRFEFSVLSYNLLADQLLRDNPCLYDNCADQNYMFWEYRKSNLLKEIRAYHADVFCFQEVQVDHYHKWFLPQLKKEGYEGMYKQRSGQKTDGCAIFYKSCKFRLLRSYVMEFTRPDVPLMDRNNVGVIAILEPRTKRHQRTPICIATTHLLFNAKRGDIKLAQLAYLFAEIERFAKLRGRRHENRGCSKRYMPIVLCGDFNSLPYSPLYEFIVKGQLKFEGMSRFHVSGQSNAMPRPGSIFGKVLLPPELNLSHLCKWKRRDVIEIKDGEDSEKPRTREREEGKGGNPLKLQEEQELTESTVTTERVGGVDTAQGFGKSLWTPFESSSTVPTVTEGATSHQPDHPNLSDEQSVQPNSSSSSRGDRAMDSEINLGKQASVAADTSQQEEPGILKHSFHFQSVYQHSLPDGSREVTTCHTKASCTVDYLFYSQDRAKMILSGETPKRQKQGEDHQLELVAYLTLLNELNVDKLGKLPNRYMSSDHLPLLALFSLR